MVQGNRIEEFRYFNDGSLQTRYRRVFDEKDRAIRLESYTSEAKLIALRVRRFDDKGNIAEESVSWRGSQMAERLSFSYEYDSRGNWIKRVSKTWVTRGEKSYFEPSFVDYRDVTYY